MCNNSFRQKTNMECGVMTTQTTFDGVLSVTGLSDDTVYSTFTISGTETAFIAGYGDLTWSDFSAGFAGYYYQSEDIIDAEKCTSITQDDMMCWAGTAANMLYYTGWDLLDTTSEDDVFTVFIDHFTLGELYGGNPYYGIKWFFTGDYTPGNWSGWDIPIENSGGFYSDFFETKAISNYLTNRTFSVSSLTTAREKLEDGYSIGILFGYYNSSGERTGGHLITMWGMTCDTSLSVNDPNYYTGIIVTDSDDSKGVSDPLSARDTLKIIEISYDSSEGKYVLDPDYAGENCILENLIFLAPNTSANPNSKEPVKIYSGNILVKEGKTFTGEEILADGNNKMLVSSGGTVNNTFNSRAMIELFGGVANSTTVTGAGTIYIYSGGTATSTTVDDKSSIGIHADGTANITTVNSGGEMYVFPYGTANNTTINSSGIGNVLGKGVANNVNVYNGGILKLRSGENSDNYEPDYASAYNVTVFSGGSANISGGVVSRLLVSSGGIAAVNGVSDTMYVDVFGEMYNTEVKSGGDFTIGTKTQLWGATVFGGTITVNDNADVYGEVTFDLSERETADGFIVNNLAYLNMSAGSFYTISVTADQAEGTYKLAQGASGFTGTLTIGDKTNNYGSITVNGADLVYNGKNYSLDLANGDLTLTIGTTATPPISGDQVQVYSSGTLVKQGKVLTGESIATGQNNSMFVYDGGTANRTTLMNRGCLMVISSGGVANNTLVYHYGSMHVSNGAVANSTVLSGVSNAYVPGWGLTVFSGGIVNNTSVYLGGYVDVSSGGVAENTVIYDNYGRESIRNGGTANSTTVLDGAQFIYSGGVANYSIANSSGGLYGYGGVINSAILINSGSAVLNVGTIANSTTVYEDANMYVYSGATANATVVNSGGDLYLWDRNTQGYYGGVANNTLINTQGYMFIARDGIANSTTNWGNMQVSTGSANYTVVNSGGSMIVASSGIASETIINSAGKVYVYNTAVANNTVVNSAGSMYIYSGGTHRLKLTMEEGAVVSAYAGGIIDFTVSEWKTTNGYLINNLSLIEGTPTYTITVSADQTEGTYKLAQGASSFTGTLTIGDGTIDYGSITVNGDDFVYNGVTYSLDQLDGNLTLTIGNGTTPPVVGDQVRVFKDDALIKQGKILIGETIIGTENDKMIVYKDGIASNTAVSSGGSVFVSNGGVIKDTTAKGNLIDIVVPLYVPINPVPAGKSLADIEVCGGGYAENLNIYRHGRVKFLGEEVPEEYDMLHGSGKNVTVYSGGSAYVSGGKITNLLVSSGGKVEYAGITDVTAVDVPGILNGGEIKSGASMIIGTDVELHNVIFGGRVIVNGWANVYGELVFDLSERTINDSYIVDNIRDLTFTEISSCAITVSADQAEGTYKLAQGASSFTGTLTIGDGSVNYGSITVNGADLVYNGVTYSLDQANGDLTLTITVAAAPPVTRGQVQVFKGDDLVKQGDILTGETIIGTGNDKMIVYKNGIAKETQVNSDGNMLVYEGGLASNTTLRGAEYIYVKDEDPRYGVYSPHPGTMNVFAGGIASNTTIYEGGKLYASGGIANDVMVHSYGFVCATDGGVVNNITTDEDWCWIKAKNGGTINNIINYGGSIGVFEDGTVNNAVLNGSPDLIYTGICVYAGGIAKNTVANNGYVTVFEGGTVDTVKVNTAAFVQLYEDAIICGKHVYGGTIDVYGTVDAARADITFDISQRKTTDRYIVSNIAYINANSYSISVSADQTEGTYKLAQGADNFTGTLTIGDGTVDYGSITVNGADFVYNGVTYSLDQLDGNLTLTISGGAVPSTTVADDLDGNGLADVILRHTKQGFTGAWLTTGDKSVIKWGSLSDIKNDVRLLGTGRLYGTENDGQDIFFADGKSVGAWKVVDGKVTGYQYVMGVNSTTNVLGLGDFNGDGATDILLRSTGGDLGFFGTDGTGWEYLKGLGWEWDIAAVGDLNGDGLDDTVLRHDAGFAGTFLTQADGTVKWANLDTLANDMSIVGTGDFNGDGVDDVLLQKADGWVGAWLVEDGSVDGFMGICKNTNSIEQIADFNGDGIDDLRIRTATGDIGVLYVNGADSTTWQYLKGVGSEWETKFSALA